MNVNHQSTGLHELQILLWHTLELAAANPATLPLFTVFYAGFLLFGGVGYDDSKIGSPYDAGTKTYSVETADKFYSGKPLFVLRRLLKLAALTGSFNLKVFLDWRTGNVEKNQGERAKEALVLATQLGPTFIKLGQALSIRTDLIPEAYALELRQLQDAVPQFDSNDALEIIKREMNIKNDIREKFLSITTLPVASASIGQVYRGTLLDGRDVAIKVQRPKVLGEIALDLYLLRLITPLQVKLTNAINGQKTEQTDIDVAISLVDEWGRGFVAEVDYRLEAYNTKQFCAAMEKRGLNAVTAPAVVDELSGSKVLVTEWVEGTRLDRDASEDVPRLCGVAVNAYLTMLLDTGVLHCDPHPGNLLRTTDGRLCVLDWGMTLEVPKDLQYGLLDFIAHINAEDFESLPEDFVNLGFTPGDKLEQVKKSGLTEGLAFTFRQLNKGGGPSKMRDRFKEEFQTRYGEGLSDDELRAAAREEMVTKMEAQLKEEGIDVNGVTGVMEEMSKRNRELFKLPPYVLYVSRAFSTLEGIGLSVNSEYSILQQCYPYLSKRLLSDNSPRSKNALKLMLFGGSNSQDMMKGAGAGMFSPAKLMEMSDGFSSYTTATASADNTKAASEAASALADVVLDPNGNYLQELLIEEAAKITDAAIRDRFKALKHSAPGQLIKTVLKTPRDLVHRFVPEALRPLAIGATLPYDVASRLVKAAGMDASDEASMMTVNSLWETLKPTLRAQMIDDVVDEMEATNKPAMAMKGKATTSIVTTASNAQQTLRNLDIPSLLPQLRTQITDPKSQFRSTIDDPKFRKQLPVIGTLGRRFGAVLLQRAADRLTAESILAKGVDNNELLVRPVLTINEQKSDDRSQEAYSLVTERLLYLTASAVGTFSKIVAPTPPKSEVIDV
eukprot:CAMPEP_0119043704 /NCGR_PEP_ID=MMETSP1177-20130426/25066_1 /TAXON_ID=2985 /ORGANISM="Ochromonas sp, Strain CCMP1899" /LENGTH=895 /DNA_ID=CAMNT_0007012395 /DNA_START=350 /DNA_END=3037 /DNA_ORIENTATION=+